MGRNLVVIGEGKELAMLKSIAGPTVKFLGRVPFPVLKEKLARCRALIFPGEEDFGLVPVEAMASGRPVIAFGSGGALETVVPGETGLLFYEQNVEAIVDAVRSFEEHAEDFDPETIRTHAARFSTRNCRVRHGLDHPGGTSGEKNERACCDLPCGDPPVSSGQRFPRPPAWNGYRPLTERPRWQGAQRFFVLHAEITPFSSRRSRSVIMARSIARLLRRFGGGVAEVGVWLQAAHHRFGKALVVGRNRSGLDLPPGRAAARHSRRGSRANPSPEGRCRRHSRLPLSP